MAIIRAYADGGQAVNLRGLNTPTGLRRSATEILDIFAWWKPWDPEHHIKTRHALNGFRCFSYVFGTYPMV